MEAAVLLEAFDRRDALAGDARERRQAGLHSGAINKNGARTALALAAAVFRSSQTEIFPKNAEQSAFALRVDVPRFAVYVQFLDRGHGQLGQWTSNVNDDGMSTEVSRNTKQMRVPLRGSTRARGRESRSARKREVFRVPLRLLPVNAPAPAENWWSRNWKWFVPLGCFGLLTITVLFVGGILFVVFGAMRSSDAFKMATARASSNPEVQAALGTPIQAGWMVIGSIKLTNASGTASLSIPISGPRGKATVYVDARKRAGEWRFVTLIVQIAKTHERIDLLNTKGEVEVSTPADEK